jgi:phosphatidylserine/phosphatidylglycerophosphate/cardiolipin synthase-like enzyme
VLLVGVLLVTAAGLPAAAGAGTAGVGQEPLAPATDRAVPSTPRFVSVYPDPVAHRDRGEFVVLALPRGDATWSLSDGESRVRLPANATPGTVAVTTDPATVRSLTDRRVVPLAADLALSNAGERLVLERNGTAVATLRYDDASEGERYVVGPADEGPRWVPLGLRLRSASRYGAACATAFVLPDAPGVVDRTLRSGQRRILLAGYSFSSRRVARTLVAAADRGVRVRVLLDAAPVGGLTAEEAAVLDYLVANGVRVRLLGGPRARFRFHHAKYAVVDDRALVLTENWKPAGTGGNDSRGWGVRIDSPAVAADLAALFASDADWRDGRRWRRVRANRTFDPGGRANGSYRTRHPPRRVRVDGVRVLTAPGNAEPALVEMLDSAADRIAIVQPTVGGPSQPLVRATLRAARRGVEVRILLSDAWYVAEQNRAFVERVNERAAARDLPVSARLADSGDRYGKIHAKGLVVDDTAVVGSLNWNNVSARENRELAVALEGPVADYYWRVFRADWQASDDGDGDLPLGLVLGVAAAAAAAVRVARRFEFESAYDERDVEDGGRT